MWHSCFWWIQKCWKTDNFDFLAILELRGQICNFELATLRQKLKLDLSLCFIYFSSGWSSVVLHISTLHFKYLPKYFKHFWKYFALELYLWSSESGKILAFVKSESDSEYGAVTQAVRRLLHNSKRVLVMMMMTIIIHPFWSSSKSAILIHIFWSSSYCFTLYGWWWWWWHPVQCPPVLASKKTDLSQPSRVDGSWGFAEQDEHGWSSMMMMMMIYPWLENQAGDDDLVLRKINPGIIIIQVILGQVADYFVLFSLCLF